MVPIFSIFRYPPLCLRHAWRVVLTAVLEFLCHSIHSSSGIPSGSPSSGWKSFQNSNLSENLTNSERTDLSQFFQRSRNPGNLKMQPLSSDISVLSQNVNKRKPRDHFPRKVSSPLGPPAGTQNPTKIIHKFNSTDSAEKIATRSA